MLDFESLQSGKPVPAVDAGDLKRVWEFTSEAVRHGSGAVDVRLIIRQCNEGADPLAVFFRAALLSPLLDSDLLENWRDGNRPRDVVFQTLATFPLPDGIQNFRPAEFAQALMKAT